MKKITPSLWFDKEAGEAARFYCSVFKGAKITGSSLLENTPSGSVEVISLDILGLEFTLISAGPLFKFNPSISFLVACKTPEAVDRIWSKLSEDSTALMDLGSYPFSERYGWLEDKYGLSWQIMAMGERKIRQRIVPTLMFVGAQCGRAEEAVKFYASVFKRSKMGDILRYGAGEEPDKEGTVKHLGFRLEGQEFAAMDSAHEHAFAFNEAVSLMVKCKDQKELDYYWGKLSADPAAEQCGWLKDQFGVSWQVTPEALEKMMKSKDRKKVARVTKAFLKMKKFDLKALKKAFAGRPKR